MHVTALPVIVPLLASAVIAGVHRWSPRLIDDLIAVGAALTAVVLCALLLAHAIHHGPFAYWMGGWRPHHSVAVGIAFDVDPIGAGIATFAAILVTGSLLYAWHYFDDADGLFQALMLVFLAALCGFALTADLFDIAVFFELMGAVAYALTAHKHEEQGPVQGAINFAISNSIGAYAIFTGIALLYARTGALNMAQIGAALQGHRADPLVLVAMALLFAGFLTKAAAVPLHFWLADAHSVAPAPVCVLFSGVMVELGVYAVARLYWTTFVGVDGLDGEALRVILVSLGTLTTLWGGVMCLTQRHLKRLLAFSTISHIGMFLCGVGLLSATGLAGVAGYVVGHGLNKAALFMLCGVLLHHFETMDEYDLHGRGRRIPAIGIMFAVGGLSLAAAPLFTVFYGKSLIDAAALEAGFPWLPAMLTLGSILTGGAVLRVAGRVFLGWGPSTHPDERQARQAREEESEESSSPDRTPPLMVIVPALLLLGAVVVGLIPGAIPGIEVAAGHLADHAAGARWELHDAPAHFAPVATSHVELYDFLYGAGSVLGAFAVAGLGLFGRPLKARLPELLMRPLTLWLHRFRGLHSGHIGDYITWWTAGTAALGGAFLVFLR